MHGNREAVVSAWMCYACMGIERLYSDVLCMHRNIERLYCACMGIERL
jgi:hypothetical protein